MTTSAAHLNGYRETVPSLIRAERPWRKWPDVSRALFVLAFYPLDSNRGRSNSRPTQGDLEAARLNQAMFGRRGASYPGFIEAAFRSLPPGPRQDLAPQADKLRHDLLSSDLRRPALLDAVA